MPCALYSLSAQNDCRVAFEIVLPWYDWSVALSCVFVAVLRRNALPTRGASVMWQLVHEFYPDKYLDVRSDQSASF